MKKTATGLLGHEYKPKARNALSGRFMCPPFTVLNAREGWWQERKRAWLSLGIRSELGRGENLLKFSDTVLAAQNGKLKPQEPVRISKRGEPVHHAAGLGIGIRLQLGHVVQEAGKFRKVGKSAYLLPPDEDDENVLTGTSIFDPVLCEIMYRWFCPDGGSIIDPFSGGSVRGIVAGELGLVYTGVDLSEKQVEANAKQAVDIGTKVAPRWHAGDSRDIIDIIVGNEMAEVPGELERFDMLFTCPPYGSLERYSDDPLDISTLSPDEFTESYFQIINSACMLLKPGSFAAIVVGDYRDDEGYYCNLPAKTIVAFEEAGLRLYNEAILITAIGSLPMRINKQFGGSRKLGKTHQNILVFAKGQPKDFVKKWEGNLLDKDVK